jgi:hypothetical protein
MVLRARRKLAPGFQLFMMIGHPWRNSRAPAQTPPPYCPGASATVFFALNIAMPNKGDDVPKREAIARAVLRSIEALPTD